MYLKDKPIKLFRDKGEKYRPVSLYLGSKKIAGYEYSEVTGESLSVSDTYNSDCSVTIKGESVQTVTEQSSNLFYGSNVAPTTASGVTRAFDEATQTWSLNGTATGEVGAAQITTNLHLTIGAVYNFKAFYQSGSLSGTGFAPSVTIAFFKGGALVTNGLFAVNSITSGSVNITIPDYDNIRFGFYWNNGNIIDNLKAKIMLSLGANSATVYEPFVPNSPSPDYPSPINSVSNFDLVSSGKNLFDGTKLYDLFANTLVNKGQNPTTWLSKINFDNRECVQNRQLALTIGTVFFDRFKPNTQYYISMDVYNDGNASGFSIKIDYSDGTSKYYLNTLLKQWQCFNVITDIGKTVTKITQTYNSMATTYFDINSIMICESNIEVPYEAFVGQVINFPYTLRSLLDGTADKIIIDDVAKTAKLYQQIVRLLFNGSESWGYRADLGNADGFCRFLKYYYDRVAGNDYIRCNRLLPIPSFAVLQNGIRNLDAHVELQISCSLLGVIGGDTSAQIITKFQTWLSSNNIEVFYKLSTPTETPLSYTAVKQYYPQTQIYTTSVVQPTLSGNFRIFSN